MKSRIINGKVFNTERGIFEARILYFDDKIEKDGLAIHTIDAKGGYVLPGFLDLHTHGRMGFDFMCAGKTDVEAVALEYAKTGVTTMYPTVMTAPLDQITNAIEAITSAAPAIRFAGIHVEGPYISAAKRGCHTEMYIRKPSFTEISLLIEKISPLHAHFTIAPEEDDDGVIRKIVEAGGSVGIGHTNGNTASAEHGVRDGAISFTHTFNAMPAMLHRNPGPVGVALSTNTFAEMIVDGIHVAPRSVAAAYNAKLRYGSRFVLVTDSLPAAGLPNGDYDLNGLPFTLKNGVACTEDGILVGSVLDIPTAIRNLMKFADLSLEEAILCATKAPAEMAGLYDTVGSLSVGKAADIVICDENLNVQKTICGGKLVYEAAEKKGE